MTMFDPISTHWVEGWEKPRAAQAPVVQTLDSAIQILNNKDQIILGRLRDIRI